MGHCGHWKPPQHFDFVAGVAGVPGPHAFAHASASAPVLPAHPTKHDPHFGLDAIMPITTDVAPAAVADAAETAPSSALEQGPSGVAAVEAAAQQPAGMVAQFGFCVTTGQAATDCGSGDVFDTSGAPWSVCVCQSREPSDMHEKTELIAAEPTLAFKLVWHLATIRIVAFELPQQSRTENCSVYVPGYCGRNWILSLQSGVDPVSSSIR
jgi:hypothetical protein